MKKNETAMGLVLSFLKIAKGKNHEECVEYARQCALITIGEKIKENVSMLEMVKVHGNDRVAFAINMRIQTLEDVKDKIINL
jgi:hypothetical protein